MEEIVVASILSIIGTLIASAVGFYIWIQKQEYKAENAEHEAPKLKNHDIFTSLDRKVNMLENEFSIDDKGREELVRAVLVNKLNIWHKYLEEVASEIQTYVETCDETDPNNPTFIKNVNMRAFNKAMANYRNFYRDLNIYTDNEIEALEVFMQKFQQYHAPSVIKMVTLIDKLSKTDYQRGLIAKQDAIFYAYLVEFNQTILDVEDTIAELNGDLSGFTFKGYELS